ncbi:MAG: Ig-like domain repeat protein [Acidobacteria bacterium]|nr:Ig-like domain repeat protein [Acidobacteriota bacterium]
MTTLRKKYLAAFCLLTSIILTGMFWANRQILKQVLASTSEQARATQPAAEGPSALGEAIQAARYNVRPVAEVGSTAIVASNPAQNLRARFTPEQVQFESTGSCQQPWQLAFKMKGLGYGSKLHEVGEGVVQSNGNRVEIKRSLKSSDHQQNSDTAQILEWYNNTPKGIEQGFHLQTRPQQETRTSQLQVVMEMSGGWKARIEQNGQALTLQNNSTTLRYDQLHTFDATGRELASRMKVEGSQLSLIVNDANAVWPLTIDPTLSQQTQFVASNGAAYDQFGYSVAISGDTAIVGVPDNDAGITFNQGAAYVFVRNGSTWSQQAQLVANDAANNDAFGWSVAISGDTAVIGAYTDDGNFADQGSAYVFTRSGTTWSQQAKLTANDGATNDWFGYSVGISGDIAVIGAPLNDATFTTNQGSAYVFVRNNGTWSFEKQLRASNAADNDNLGFAVAISGMTTVVGSPSADINGNSDQGAAYVFTRNGISWNQQQQLTAGNGSSTDQLGYSVAISNDTVIIGAPLDDVNANIDQGSAYAFIRTGSSWSQQQQLIASNGSGADQFGSCVAISNDMAAIGAPTDDVTSNADQGSAYIFSRSASSWSQQQQLIASNGSAYDDLGWAIGISGYTIVVGAPVDDVASNTDQGSAYIFSPTCPSITLNPTTLANGTQNLTYTATTIVPSSGTSPFTYEITSGALPSGLTLSSDGLLSGTPSVAGDFNFTIKISDTNLCNGSRAYSLTINSCAPPSITTQPTNQTAAVAGSASFTAAAGGTPPTVQWQVSTDNGNTWENLSNQTNPTLNLSNVTILMNGNKYRAVFTNACGTATTNAVTLTVNKLTPAIALNSSSTTTTYGQSVTFSASVSGAVATTGIVTFKNGATTLGTGTISNGQASFTTSSLNAGNYSITAEYAGDTNYVSASSSAITQTINKATLTVTAENKARTYGTANPDLTATIAGFVNGDTNSVVSGTPSITTAATAASPASTYPITVTQGTLAADNYNFTLVNGTLTVGKALLTVTADNKAQTYGAVLPSLTATITGFLNSDTSSVLTGEAALNTSATNTSATGVYPITVTQGTLAATNYDFTFVNGTLTVGKATLTVSADNKTKLFGATLPEFTFSYAGFANGDSATVVSGSPTLSTTATAGSNAGQYPISIALGTLAAANYDFAFVNGTLTISKAMLIVTAENKSRTYGSANPPLTTTITGFVNGDTVSVLSGEAVLSTSAHSASAVGAYPIQVTAGTLAASNYDFTFINGSLTISKALLTVTADNKSRVYGAANPSFTATISGFVNNESPSVISGEAALSTTATTTSSVGLYAINAAPGTLAATNYDFAFANGTLTIGQATLTVTAENKSRIYGAANPNFTIRYSGFANNDTETVLTGTPEVTTTATPNSVIGTYPISVKPGSLTATNYQLAFADGTLTISKAMLSAAVTDATRSYGAANPTFAGTMSGVQNNDNITASYTTNANAGSAVGSYPITTTLNDPENKLGNYEVAVTNGTLTVTPATLTITADHKTRLYGAANPELTASINGLVNNETAAVFTGSLQLTTEANPASAAGNYPISVSGVSSANYTISFVSGTLTINKALLTVTAENKSRTYGAANPTLTATITGFVNGETSNVLTGEAALSTTATSASAAGTYPITAAQGTLAASNYDFTFVNGTLTIGKATLTITADNKSKVFGAALPELTYSYTGFLNGDTANVLTGAPSITTSANANSNAGQYPISISAGSLTATSYDIAFTSGTLTITPANTAVALVSNAPSALVGQSVIFTATVNAVTPGVGTPTGTITFKNGETTLGTAQLANGQASVTTNQLTIGTHSITATYAGTENFNTSTSPTISQSVGKSGATVTLASSLDTVRYGQPFTLNASVSGTGATPTGSVRFMNGTSLLGTATLANGAASLTLNALPVATHLITAVYEGDAQNDGGTSQNFSVTVNKGIPTINISSSDNPVALKQFVTLAVNLNNNVPEISAPSGTVVFKDGSTVLGTSNLDRLGRANLATNQLSGGAHSITVEFNGDGNYESGSSSVLPLNVGKGRTAIRLTTTAKNATVGHLITFAATVHSAGDVPTGQVDFFDGTTLLGSATLNGGVAVLTTGELSNGEHSITAEYKGDDKSASSKSAVVNQTMTPYCTWNLSTSSMAFNPQGGFGQIAVETPSYCYWYAYTTSPWITVMDYGPEVGAVSFIVSPLTNGSARTGTIFIADKRVTIVQSKTTTSVSGASFQGGSVATNSIVSVFGEEMATNTASAQSLPLPTSLANTKVKITDSTGTSHFAPLFYVSPLQINYQVPADVASGPALLTIQTEAGEITGSGMIEIAPISPAVFSANSSGKDLAAANIQRVRLDGSQSFEEIARWDAVQNKIVPVPIDMGEEGEEVYLVLYGTGIRSRIDLITVRALINNQESEVLYADTQGYFVGVDQMNLKLPRTLAGKGDVEVKIIIEGRVANTVRINLK